MLRRVLCICLAAVFAAAGQTGPSAVTAAAPAFRVETANALRIDPAIAQRMVAEQQQDDQLIGIWSAQGGTYRCRFAMVKNPNRLNDAFDYVGIMLDPWPGFESSEAAIFLSRTADGNTYTGREKWKDAQSFSKLWYPTQVILTSNAQGMQINMVDLPTPLGTQWTLTRTSEPQAFQPSTRTQPALAQALSPTPAAMRSTGPFVLEDGTPVKLRTGRTISSAEARVGDTLDFEVLEEVRVGDVVVIPQGGIAWATVTEAEHKKRMGRGGKLNMNVDAVKLMNGQRAPLRAVQGGAGGGHVGAMTGAIVATAIVFWPAAPLFLFMHGKDLTVPKGTAVTAYINGNVPLDKGAFVPKTDAAQVATGGATTETVSITSVPPNADIEVDGSFVGSTPSSLTLAPGDHTITVTHKGFKKWERKVKTSSGTVNLNVELEVEAAP